MKKIFYASLFCALLFQNACGMKHMATNVIGKISVDGIVALEGEEDVPFARLSTPPLIKTLEVLKQGNPKDFNSLTLLSQAYGQYAFGFLEEDMLAAKAGSPEYQNARYEADLFYRRGRDYGIAALITNGSMKKAFKSPLPDFKKSVSKLGKKYVPALFWTAFNWSNYLNMHLDDLDSIAELPRIQAMIDRVLELDPDFNCGSAHVLKGVIAASRPKALGGDPKLAEDEFGLAMKSSPDYLMTKVIFAQYYAKQMQNKALFKKELSEVLEADAKKLPPQRLANELAKRRAKILLTMEKSFFE